MSEKTPELYDIQKEFIKDCSSTIDSNKIGIFSSPTGTGKTLSLLLSVKSFLSDENDFLEDDKILEDLLGRSSSKPKIYYCSRTHSQLKQVVNEFKRLGIKTSSVVLGSRKVYCINKDVNKQTSIESINMKCRDLVSDNKCKFHIEHYKERGVFSIEDLLRDASEHNYCPYYFTKEHFKNSEMVFLPYNLLFSEESRDSLGMQLDGAIIIVDEAHNIIETVVQMNSSLIRIDDIKRYILAANKYKTVLKSGSKNSQTVVIVIEVLTKIVKFLSNLQKECVFEVSDFLIKSGLLNINTLELTEEIKNSRLIFKLENYEKKLNLKLQDISKFLKLLVASDKSSRIECNVNYLKIFPLNPKIFFEPFKHVKSIIFAGGTMEPIDELKRMFDYRDVVNYSYQSSERNFKAFVVNSFNKKELEIKKSTREDEELFKSLQNMIIDLIKGREEGGVVVFLPSKFYLDVFKKLFMNCEYASCYFEDTNKFEEYVLNVRRRSCVLFAVVGGTYSEGVNFSDDLCRILVIIGIPYPNIDVEINERIKMFGYDWYTQVAMKKVNQTIGRAIRHNDDYAAILLVDKRFSKLRKYFSSWILTSLETDSFETIKQRTKKFLLDSSNK